MGGKESDGRPGCIDKTMTGFASGIALTACLGAAAFCSGDTSSFNSRTAGEVFGLGFNGETNITIDPSYDGKTEISSDWSISEGENTLLGVDLLISSDPNAKPIKGNGVWLIAIKPSR